MHTCSGIFKTFIFVGYYWCIRTAVTFPFEYLFFFFLHMTFTLVAMVTIAVLDGTWCHGDCRFISRESTLLAVWNDKIPSLFKLLKTQLKKKKKLWKLKKEEEQEEMKGIMVLLLQRWELKNSSSTNVKMLWKFSFATAHEKWLIQLADLYWTI